MTVEASDGKPVSVHTAQVRLARCLGYLACS